MSEIYFSQTGGLGSYSFRGVKYFSETIKYMTYLPKINDFVLFRANDTREPLSCEYDAYKVSGISKDKVQLIQPKPLTVYNINVLPYILYGRSRLSVNFIATTEELIQFSRRFLDRKPVPESAELDPNLIYVKFDLQDKKILRAVYNTGYLDSTSGRYAKVYGKYYGYLPNTSQGFFWLSSKKSVLLAEPLQEGIFLISLVSDVNSSYYTYCERFFNKLSYTFEKV